MNEAILSAVTGTSVRQRGCIQGVDAGELSHYSECVDSLIFLATLLRPSPSKERLYLSFCLTFDTLLILCPHRSIHFEATVQEDHRSASESVDGGGESGESDEVGQICRGESLDGVPDQASESELDQRQLVGSCQVSRLSVPGSSDAGGSVETCQTCSGRWHCSLQEGPRHVRRPETVRTLPSPSQQDSHWSCRPDTLPWLLLQGECRL